MNSSACAPAEQIDREERTLLVCVDGMTCQSCELIIERTWRKLEGIQGVEVKAATGTAVIRHFGDAPSINRLQQSLGQEKYTVRLYGTAMQKTRPTLLRLIGLFALVVLLGEIVSRLGLLKTRFTVGTPISLAAIFTVGLIAASSSCVAIVGGLLLSSAAKFNQRHASASTMARLRPTLFFVIGRIAGYGLFGGLLGVIGKVLAPSPAVTAAVTIVAAVYMLMMGLDMLGMAPAWLKRLVPKMPKAISRRVMDAEGKEHPLAPLALGAATFFLPCGFTQAFQLYALTTGSFVTGGLTLLAFALGTAPALLALGWASSSLKGKTGKLVFQFSGALVVVLGLWNIQNGLTIAGYPLSWPTALFSSNQIVSQTPDPSVTRDGNIQVMKMAVHANGYQPNQFIIRAGMPTRWEIDGTEAAGCAAVLVSRQLGVQKFLAAGTNTIEFTAPTQPGSYQFSCSMGMYRGQIHVISNG